MEQMTIFDLLGHPKKEDDLTESMRHTMIEGGKIRIYALYLRERDKRKRAKFIAKEYGLGGRSMKLNNGENGFVDFNGKGVRIYSFRSDYEKSYRWSEAEQRIHTMIAAGNYLNDEEMSKWNTLCTTVQDKMPYPEAGYRYPPDIDDNEEWEDDDYDTD